MSDSTWNCPKIHERNIIIVLTFNHSLLWQTIALAYSATFNMTKFCEYPSTLCKNEGEGTTFLTHMLVVPYCGGTLGPKMWYSTLVYYVHFFSQFSKIKIHKIFLNISCKLSKNNKKKKEKRKILNLKI